MQTSSQHSDHPANRKRPKIAGISFPTLPGLVRVKIEGERLGLRNTVPSNTVVNTVVNHVVKRCEQRREVSPGENMSMLGPTGSRISPSILQYTKINTVVKQCEVHGETCGV